MPSAAPEESKTTLEEGKAAPKFQAPKKKRKWPRRLILLAVVVVVIALALRGCLNGAKQIVQGSYLPVQATRQDLSVTVTGTGTVKPNDSYRATTLLRGEILSAPFEEGDMVAKDQVLFTLDPTDAENNITSAESNLSRAQLGVDQAVHSKEQAQLGVDQAKLALDQAQLGLDQAKLNRSRAQLDIGQAQFSQDQADLTLDQANLGVEQAQTARDQLLRTQADNQEDMSIKANADGTVSKVYIDPGDTVAAGTPIADIIDRDTMELTVPFHSVQAQTFVPGQSAFVTVTGSAAPLSGTVSEVGAVDQVLPGNAVVRQVVIQVPNPGALDQGTTATAQVGQAASAGVGSFDYASAKQIIAMMSGKVETLALREGDRVTNGQVIGSFEPPDLQDQLDNAALAIRNAQLTADGAQLALDNTQTTFDNAQFSQDNAQLAVDNAQLAVDNAQLTYNNALLSVGTAQLAVDNAKLSLQDAQEALRIARDALDDYTISSPIDGTVIEKNYKAGDNIDPSTAATSGQSAYMAVIYDLSRLTFDMDVSELDVAKLKVGQSVTFTSDAVEGKTFTGHVDKININGVTVSGSTNYPVTIVIDQGDGLYPGMNVSATILVEELGNALCVPAEAVQRGNFVYVAGPGALNDAGELVDFTQLEERPVELGQADSAYIEILSGLSEGETVYLPNQASSAMESMATMMGG